MTLARFPNFSGDLRGAFASLLVGLPYSITAGMLAFAPLGPEYIASGIVAGVASTAVVGIVAALIGGTACQINGPRGSVAVLMAGMITAIANHSALGVYGDPDIPQILGIAMLCIALAGLLQVAFGLFRFGAVVRFLPYPVISGFMIALGILVLWPQFPAFFGLAAESGWADFIREPILRWGAIAVGLATVVAFFQSRKLFPKAPAPLIGILTGVALHYLLIYIFGNSIVGPTGLSALESGTYPPHSWKLPTLQIDHSVLEVLISVAPSIVTIAFIGSLESLLSSSVLSIASQMRYNSNRELISQGLSNVAVAAVGGIVSCGAPFRGVANYLAGGRTPLSGALHSAMAIPLLLFAMPVLLATPIAALAGVLIVAGWDVILAWFNRLKACPNDDIVVGTLVMIATLLMGTMPAILFGIVGAMFLYVRNTSRAPLRGHYDGSIRKSTRVRPEEQAAYLRSLGSSIRVVDAQGSLFFGNADRFGRDVEDVAKDCKHLILNMQRVYEIDPTGALVLMQTMRRLKEQGIHTTLASISINGRRGGVLTRAGIDKIIPPEHWFEDVDHALEYAEDQEINCHWPDKKLGHELPISAMDICAGLSAQEVSALEKFLVRTTVPANTVLFRENDPGDCLYLLALGEITVSVRIPGKDGRNRRLATYCPGVMVGEMAVIEGKRRSADGVTVSDCVLYKLDGPSLVRMNIRFPELYGHFMLNITQQLVRHLRNTTLELRVAYS